MVEIQSWAHAEWDDVHASPMIRTERNNPNKRVDEADA
jgi:hypothetical protein